MKSPCVNFNTVKRYPHAFSLLEMIMAAALVTGTVVPALAVIRDAMAQSRDLHRRHLLSNYAVELIEDHAAYAATNWINTTTTGNFNADGHSSIRYTLTRSDAVANGGLVGQLMVIEATVFDDTDGDTIADASERQETYRTKVAKMNSYENEEQ